MKKEDKALEENNSLYEKIRDDVADQRIGDVINVFAYILADVCTDTKPNVDKKAVVSHFVNLFDSAYGFLKEEKK